MRELGGRVTLDVLSSDALSVLQLWTINEPLLPNLKTLDLWKIEGPLIPFIPLFLSPRTTSISLRFFDLNPPKVAVASVIITIPILCPELQAICLYYPPGDPMIIAAVSKIVLTTNRTTLQKFHVDFPLTEEASEVVYKLPNLRKLSVVTEGEGSLPSASLPNLTQLVIACDNEEHLSRLFRGATFGKLESVVFSLRSKQIGDFLKTFERVTLSLSVQNTLSMFRVFTSCSWDPNYSSLLLFTQLVCLIIGSPCDDGCSSRVDDDVIIKLSRAMPRLKVLRLGDMPCQELTTGATAKGLVALSLHCPDLWSLCIHFQVASLTAPPTNPGMTPNVEPTVPRTGRSFMELIVGKMSVPEESVRTVALALLRIFPRIEYIGSMDKGWRKVKDAIRAASKHRPLTTPWRNDTFIGATPETGG